MTDTSTSKPPEDEGDAQKKPKTKKDEVKLWSERVALAKQDLDDWKQKSGADRYVQEYNGKFEIFFNGLKGKIPVPPINKIFAYVQTDLANTSNRDPYIAVNPKAGTVLGAKLWEAILNYYWRELRTKQEVEGEIIDKDLVGYAWHKVGHEVESTGPEQDMKITDEKLYSARVDWKDVVFNLGAKNPPYDCMWMAQRIVKPLLYIKGKYPNARNLKGVQNPEIDKSAYEKATFKDDISVGVIWEIWDRTERCIYLYAEGLEDKWLADPREWPSYMDEFPFLFYWDYQAPGQKRPLSIIGTWEPQLHEEMILSAAAVNHHKRWNRQMLAKKGAISGGDLDKYERGEDGAIIDYTGTGELDKTVKFLDWGSMPTDFYGLMDRLQATVRDVSGQAEFMRGGVTKTSTRTEGELQMIAQGAKGRTDRRTDRFETHLQNIARHMMMHLKANFDFENTVRITGGTPDDVIAALGDHYLPMTKQVVFTTDDIKGEYEAEIKAGSTLPLDNETKQQIIKDVIQTVATVGVNGVSPLLRTLISELLDMYQIKSLQLAYMQEQQQDDQEAAANAQAAEAEQLKQRTQAAKNYAQTDKVSAEADALHIQNAAKESLAHTYGVDMLAPNMAGGNGSENGV